MARISSSRPGELKVPTARGQLGPCVREFKTKAVDPPDVLTGWINEFQFEVIARKISDY
jgi:hypothetical protein